MCSYMPVHLVWVLPQSSLLVSSARKHRLLASLEKFLILTLPPAGNVIVRVSCDDDSKTVTATASSQDKLDWLLALPDGQGATHGVNYKTQDFAEEVKRVTGGKGVDVIIDFVGQSHWHMNIEALALDGRMTILGLLSGACLVALVLHKSIEECMLSRPYPRILGLEVSAVNLGPILFKRLRIQGSTLRSRTHEYHAKPIDRSVSHIAMLTRQVLENICRVPRFRQEVVAELSGSQGNGRLRIYVDKVRVSSVALRISLSSTVCDTGLSLD